MILVNEAVKTSPASYILVLLFSSINCANSRIFKEDKQHYYQRELPTNKDLFASYR